MQEKLPELENLVSRSGRTTSNYKTATFAAIGVYLIGGTLWRYYSLGITDKALPNIILGFASFFALKKYQKLVYLSPDRDGEGDAHLDNPPQRSDEMGRNTICHFDAQKGRDHGISGEGQLRVESAF